MPKKKNPFFRKIQKSQQAHIYGKTPKRKYSQTKNNCKKTKIQFLLTLSEFEAFHGKPCYYCGKFFEASGASLDRVDNTMGYIITNVVPCCFKCNRMKSNLPFDMFLKIVETVYKNLLAKGLLTKDSS